MKPFLIGQSLDELTAYVEAKGFPKFRARQLFSWLYDHAVCDPAAMGNLPGDLRAAVREDFYAPGSRIAESAAGADGVEKLLDRKSVV